MEANNMTMNIKMEYEGSNEYNYKSNSRLRLFPDEQW
jgi:hypothetical protein